MDALSDQQKSLLQHQLTQREHVLREDIRREMNLKDDYVQLASEAPDTGDLSFANLSVDLGNAAVTRDVTELRAIELAQKKMLTGSYGECITCGYAIQFERLMAVLSAERCAPCQEKFERTHMDGMRGASM
jgi:RNA polymerase-binding transcription factor DksA